ncbi:glycosyltransferase family 2 protein [Patescibacteria group bacterium]|nr:glycosyltransferase family 2 protein [Patescibacteria group bacterium]MBU1922235.1 glycosyltransferase family 2 protein [Patescibacteria group bacterium]
MTLSIIIVNWNVKDLLRKCLSTLFKYNQDIDFEVFVVDNASSDASVDMIKNEFPQVKLIANDENLGFAGANNQAIEKCVGDFILLLNPDTEFLDNHCLSTVVELMKKRPRVGIGGPRLLDTDMSIQASVRAFPDIISQIGILLKIHHVWPNCPWFKRYFQTNFNYHEEVAVDQVMGAFFLIKREVLKKIGPLDSGYFCWFEEVDYCWQAKQAGWETRYFPQSELIHHGGASFKQVLKPRNQKIFNQSMFRYFYKNHSKPRAYILAIFFLPALILSRVNQALAAKKSK